MKGVLKKPVRHVIDVSGIRLRMLPKSWGEQSESRRLPRILTVVCIAALTLFITACGGGGSSSTPVVQNPAPSVFALSPASAPAGSRELTLTVFGSGFISGSVVQWSGSAKTTTYVSSSQLRTVILPADLSNARTVAVSVFNPTPGGGTSSSLSFSVNSVQPLSLLTLRLPDASPSKAYEYTLQASGGIQPYSWSVASGSLPDGLNLADNGVISGTPSAVSKDTTVSFAAELSDYAYQPNTLTQSLSIRVRTGKLGRNDTCGTATPVSNGVIRASISPYGDVDVYSFQGTAGASITAGIDAQSLSIYSNSGGRDVFLDSVLEILDSNCNQLDYSDDITIGVNQDSLIEGYPLPYTGTYYLRVSDLRGDGRPDFIYELHLSGAN